MPVMEGVDSGYIDVDKGFTLAFIGLLCLLLLAMIVRCTKMVINPYSVISTSTYQEE
ncbi:cortexin domain-containing 1 protein-like [Narcine bancroftii]|uniref:cortexin domain-containing 1 protein-like n=1 Tax=Narcine bancroftii TaxID=1343680 RepID=UPI003831D177